MVADEERKILGDRDPERLGREPAMSPRRPMTRDHDQPLARVDDLEDVARLIAQVDHKGMLFNGVSFGVRLLRRERLLRPAVCRRVLEVTRDWVIRRVERFSRFHHAARIVSIADSSH
jgi:hypothetical protein